MNLFNALSLENDREDSLLGSEFQIFNDHVELSDRIRKTLYYGKLPNTDRPSLALTGISVEMFSKVLPNDGLKVLDMHYAASVARRACITPCSMMLAMVYLDQLRHKNPQYLTMVSSCDLFLVSMMVASKFLYDDGEEDEVFNDEWAASANMELKDLNQLEREFLAALDWNLYVKPMTFSRVLENAENRIAHLESRRRGWSTYTDICVLSKGAALYRCWLLVFDGVIKVIAVSSVAYIAAALTIFGSAVVVDRLVGVSHRLAAQTWDVKLPASTFSGPIQANTTCHGIVSSFATQPVPDDSLPDSRDPLVVPLPPALTATCIFPNVHTISNGNIGTLGFHAGGALKHRWMRNCVGNVLDGGGQNAIYNPLISGCAGVVATS
uniref:Protein CNPPD1 n=2 Tax=Ornithodoros turicata TaxID=34597 RepID=A0A2R5LK23_9ACAR